MLLTSLMLSRLSDDQIQGLLPGVAYLFSRYYRRQELIARIGFFLALSPALSGGKRHLYLQKP